MKLCVYGAGAIGGQVGAMLAKSGTDVSLIARGPHLAAMKENGLTLITPEERFVVTPKCTDNPTELEKQDYIFVSLKAHSVVHILNDLDPILGPDTVVVTAVNGIPWWYFFAFNGSLRNHQLRVIDPGGCQWKKIKPERVLGCVVWQAAEVIKPGVIRLNYSGRMPIGEPDGSRSERARILSDALITAGIKSPVKKDIRNEIWMKLWGNLSFNPMSMLTHGTMEQLANDDDTLPVIRQLMVEAQTIGEALGVKFPIDVDKRIQGARSVGSHRTSMLQDLEKGRLVELDALMGSIIELSKLVRKPAPTMELIYGLARQRARQANCYPEPTL